MNRVIHLRSAAIGFVLAVGLTVASMVGAAPISGPVDPASIVSQVNQYLLNWMSFPAAELGEMQLLGAHAWVHAGSNHYVALVDDGGTARYILTTTATTP